MRKDAERRGAERERFSEEEEGSTKKDQWEKSENTKTSGDFLTERKCFQVCLL